MHAAVDEAVDKLYRQLNKQKERLKTHHASRPIDLPNYIEPETGVEWSEDEDERRPLVHVERLEMKPQFEDEAIEEMEALGKNFYVFLNARNEQVCVVYHRTDGSYGLIEPRAG